MTKRIILTSARPLTVPATPRLVTSALRVLGIPVAKGGVRFLDKELTLFDARVAFKVKIRQAHADVGGSDDAARPIIEAYRIVKRWATAGPWRTWWAWKAEQQRAAADQL